MKYCINGFQQREIVSLGLDSLDADILRWFVDFMGSGKMAVVLHDNKNYFWVKYDAVIEDLPILGIDSTDGIYRRFKKFVKCGLMDSYTKRKGGTFSCYRLNEKVYSRLIKLSDEKPTALGRKTESPPKALGRKVGAKDPNTNNPNTNNTTENIVFPLLLNADSFKSKWDDWEKYRKEIKKKLTESTRQAQLKNLSKFQIDDAIKMIDQSIINGWTGLFEIKNKSFSNDNKKPAYSTINEKSESDIMGGYHG